MSLISAIFVCVLEDARDVTGLRNLQTRPNACHARCFRRSDRLRVRVNIKHSLGALFDYFLQLLHVTALLLAYSQARALGKPARATTLALGVVLFALDLLLSELLFYNDFSFGQISDGERTNDSIFITAEHLAAAVSCPLLSLPVISLSVLIALGFLIPIQ